MASELVHVALHDDNFCKFYVSNACISDACAVEPRRRFVTERGKKKKKKEESRNLNPGCSAWVKSYQVELDVFKENAFYGLQKILLDNFSRSFYI